MVKTITFKLDEKILYLLDVLADKMRKTRSEIIREALLEYLKKEIVKG